MAMKDYWAPAREKLSDKEREILKQALEQPSHKDLSENTPQTSTLAPWPEQVVEICKQRQAGEHKRRWKFRVAGRDITLGGMLDNIVKLLEKIKLAGDIAVNADPIHAGLPWAAVRILLTVATANGQQAGALYAGIERVLLLMNRGMAYEHQLASSCKTATPIRIQTFESFLISLYARLLSFLASGLRVLAMGSLRKALHALWNPQEIIQFETDYLKLEADVRKESDILLRSVSDETRDAVIQIMESTHLHSMTLDTISTSIGEIKSKMEKEREENERMNVLSWASKLPVDDHHTTARQNRTPDTGQWIIQKPAFQSWITSQSPLLLWIHGIPGAGKTKLVSSIIDHYLKSWRQGATCQTRSSPEGYFCFFYCIRVEDERRQAIDILQSIIKQLALANTEAYNILRDKYKQKEESGFLSKQLTIDECEALLTDMISSVSMTIIAIDALDECFESARSELIDVFSALIEYGLPVKVLVSSRRDGDIKERLEEKANISISATDNEDDILKFVKERLAQHRATKRGALAIPEDVEQEILTTIQTKSDGMFQWAALHIEHILTLNRKSDVKKALHNLPKSLDKTYDEIFERIENMDGSMSDVALRCIQWILVRGGTAGAEILAVACQDSKDEIQEVDIDTETLLSGCQNLVTVEIRNPLFPLFRFAHLSVQEYCEKRAQISSTVHSFAATTCVHALLYGDLSVLYTDDARYKYHGTGIFLDSQMILREFYRYAVQFWIYHLQKSMCQANRLPDPDLGILLRDFTGYPGRTSQGFDQWQHLVNEINWSMIYLWAAAQGEQYSLRVSHRHLNFGHSSLVTICFFGLDDVIKFYGIDQSEAPSTTLPGTLIEDSGFTPYSSLSSASRLSHLVQSMAGLDKCSLTNFLWGLVLKSPVLYRDLRFRNMAKPQVQQVQTAAELSHTLAIDERRQLCGAAISWLVNRFLTSEVVAGDIGGKTWLLQELDRIVEFGADLYFNRELLSFAKGRDGHLYHPLALAIAQSDNVLAKWALDKGSRPPIESLIYVCWVCGHESRAQESLLLKPQPAHAPDPGSDLESEPEPEPESDLNSPLESIVRFDIFRMLLSEVDDVNKIVQASDLTGYGPGIIKTRRGSDIVLGRNVGGTALLISAFYGHAEMCKVLIAKGAKMDIIYSRDQDANDQGSIYIEDFLPTALVAACWNGDMETCQLLLEHGADVNLKARLISRNGSFITPLIAAAWAGHAQVCELLFQHGATVEFEVPAVEFFPKCALDAVAMRTEQRGVYRSARRVFKSKKCMMKLARILEAAVESQRQKRQKEQED